MCVTDPCVQCGVRQRIPTLNLIQTPKLNLIPKVITVATPPTTHPKYCDPIYTHSHSRTSTHSHTHTLVCRSVVRCWVCVLLLQDLLQSCARGGRRRVEDMCYERRRAEACVDESAHHALVNAGAFSNKQPLHRRGWCEEWARSG